MPLAIARASTVAHTHRSFLSLAPGSCARKVRMCMPGRASIARSDGSVFFFQAEDGIRDASLTGVQTCALPIYETLKGTRQLWLYNPENFSPEQIEEFAGLKDLHLKVARAWAAKEL